MALLVVLAVAVSAVVAGLLWVTLGRGDSSAASLRSMLSALPTGRYDPAGSYPGPNDDPVRSPPTVV